MDGYGVMYYASGRGTGRYRTGADGETASWDLTEAERIAHEILIDRGAVWVTIGDGFYEFRMWNDNVEDDGAAGNFNHPGRRWAAWYVDAEISGHRWRYRPMNDMDSYAAADSLAEELAELYPDVTRVWLGRSDGSEETAWETRDDQ